LADVTLSIALDQEAETDERTPPLAQFLDDAVAQAQPRCPIPAGLAFVIRRGTFMARKAASDARPRRPALSRTGEITADASLAQAEKNAEYFKRLLTDTHAHGDMDSVREADHKGHHIVITTTYRITIDGKPFTAALGVANDGSVHYHGMPNVGFDSAIELMKAVIDTFVDDFSGGGGHGEDHGPGAHEHGGGHEHGNITARPRPRKNAAPTRTKTTRKPRRSPTRARR
jgi:hypothetical protein